MTRFEIDTWRITMYILKLNEWRWSGAYFPQLCGFLRELYRLLFLRWFRAVLRLKSWMKKYRVFLQFSRYHQFLVNSESSIFCLTDGNTNIYYNECEHINNIRGSSYVSDAAFVQRFWFYYVGYGAYTTRTHTHTFPSTRKHLFVLCATSLDKNLQLLLSFDYFFLHFCEMNRKNALWLLHKYVRYTLCRSYVAILVEAKIPCEYRLAIWESIVECCNNEKLRISRNVWPNTPIHSHTRARLQGE